VDFDFIIVTLLSAASSAASLLIASIGLAAIFGLMGVVNLAHGEFIMLGAYAALAATRAGMPYWLSIVFATLAMALFGAVVERVIIRPLYGRLLDTMLATWGLSLVLYQAAVITFGSVTPGLPLTFPSVTIGHYGMSSYLLVLIGIAVVLLGAVYTLLTRTHYGVLARAVTQDATMAAAIGAEPRLVNAATFSLGAGLAGFAGAVLLPVTPASPGMGFSFAVKAFLGVMAAGPLTLSGTAAAVGTMGAAAHLSSIFWSSTAGDIVFFVITIALLALCPNGISKRWRLKL
jgi:urea transport system permease protein